MDSISQKGIKGTKEVEMKPPQNFTEHGEDTIFWGSGHEGKFDISGTGMFNKRSGLQPVNSAKAGLK